ncbi:hypothetical protein EV128_107199 [Rhizobium azibense]|nr:hypothetical protein EV128_107199 [Rhizobium azibense]
MLISTPTHARSRLTSNSHPPIVPRWSYPSTILTDSALNSHLIAGGSVFFPGICVMDGDFARIIDESDCTNLSGVPYTYELGSYCIHLLFLWIIQTVFVPSSIARVDHHYHCQHRFTYC